MAYITLANSSKIVFNGDLKGLNLKGEIYKIPIQFFSNYEKNALLAIQELLKNPEEYFSTIYKPYEPVDTYRFVYEGNHPSYHSNTNCPRLNALYKNFEIPQSIRDRGIELVKEFRVWFESVKHLLDRPDVFAARLQAKWGIVTNPNAISIDNSGHTEIENISIQELEEKIDSKLKEAGRFYSQDNKHKIILKRFSKFTFLAYKSEKIENNGTGYSDSDVKDLLKKYDTEFKKPLKKMLIEYYRLKHNPEIRMEGDILEQLGFKPCAFCHDVVFYVENDNNDLPF